MLSEARDMVLLHTGVAKRLAAALAGRSRPSGDERVSVVGHDPLRVLVVGAGLAVGYGVTRWEDGLGGALGRAIGAATNRGVVVDHRTRPDLPMLQSVALLGASGAHTYDLVVWCPTFTELPRTWRLRRWLVDLRRIMGHLVETGDRRTAYLLLGFPLIADEGPLERIASAFVHRINARIGRVAREFPRTAFTYPPPAEHIGRALDAAYYERCAAAVLPVAMELLRGMHTPA